MKKIISILCVLLLCSASYAVSFGRTSSGTVAEKTWSPTLFSTLTNVQQTNYDAGNGENGYLVLTFLPTTSSEAWNTIPAGWIEGGGGGTGADTKIEPAGWLHQSSWVVNTETTLYNLSWAGNGVTDTSNALGRLISFEGFSTSTETTSKAGEFLTNANGTRGWQYSLRSDGSYLDLYLSDALGTWTKKDTTINIDNRVHIQLFYNPNSNNSTVMSWDGEEVATGLKTFAQALLGQVGYVESYTQRRSADPAIVGSFTTGMYYWNTLSSWTNALATVECDYTQPEFDAGSRKRWASVLWDANMSNSTIITMEVRCTNEVTGMLKGTFEVITYPSTTITRKGQYIDVRFKMTGSTSGRYTPTMKYLQLDSEDIPTGTGIYSKKNKGWSKK